MEAHIFRTAALDPIERDVLDEIERLRDELRFQVSEPRRWFGRLRRMTLVRAVQASTAIEGYRASLDDAAAVVDGEEPVEADEETRRALAGYRDAMTYVLQVARDPMSPPIDAGLIKALHFMMLRHDLARHPGQWRPGPVFVREDQSGRVVYEGPPAEQVPELVEAMVAALAADRGPVVVRAAMAHLNLVMIHPFSDGNGRMARCLQTLVLARERILSPTFSSIEEYLGRNTQAYYAVLAEVGQGSWNPHADTRPWIRFCLTAHLRQARTLLWRVREAEALWLSCLELAEDWRLPERVVGPLCDAASGLRLRNATYRAAVRAADGADISELTATRDLKALVDAGLLEPVGQTRGRHYVATPTLSERRRAIRARRHHQTADDPFADRTLPGQLELPL
jgi:Fic family protein